MQIPVVIIKPYVPSEAINLTISQPFSGIIPWIELVLTYWPAIFKDHNPRINTPNARVIIDHIFVQKLFLVKMNTIEFIVIQMYAITITTNTIIVKPNNDQTKYVYVSLFASIKTFQWLSSIDQLVPLPIQMKIPKAKAIHKVFTKAAHKAALKLALALIVNLFV